MNKCFFSLMLCWVFFLHSNNPSWNTPVLLSTVAQAASYPCIAMDSSGRSLAIWKEQNAVYSKWVTTIACYDAPGTCTWLGGAPISGTSTTLADLNLVITETGEASAFWTENHTLYTNTFSMSSPAWGSPSSLNYVMDTDSLKVVIDPVLGTIAAIWSWNGAVQVAIKRPGGAWPKEPTTLSYIDSSRPNVAIGYNNSVIGAVWQRISGDLSIIEATANTSGSWNPVSPLSDFSFKALNPSISVDNTGSMYVIWYRYSVLGSDYYNVDLRGSFLYKNSKWTTPQTLSTISGKYNPALLHCEAHYNPQGVANWMWSLSETGNSFSIIGWSNQKGVGDPAVLAVENPFLYAWNAYVTPNTGEAFIAYMAATQNPPAADTVQIYALKGSTLSPEFKALSAIQVSASNPTANGYPKIAATSQTTPVHQSYATTVWKATDDVSEIPGVYAASWHQIAPAAPTNFSVAQTQYDSNSLFLGFYNNLTWSVPLGSSGYYITRNEQLITPVALSPGDSAFIDDNRFPLEADEYALFSFDIPGGVDVSLPVTVTFPP